MKHAYALLAPLLLVSCAMTPLTPFSSRHPASAQASEAVVVPFESNLSEPDSVEQQTQRLFDSREE